MRTIRNSSGQVLGRIEESGNGELVARTAGGRLVGRYIPSRDMTYDSSGRQYGNGNQLDALIRD